MSWSAHIDFDLWNFELLLLQFDDDDGDGSPITRRGLKWTYLPLKCAIGSALQPSHGQDNLSDDDNNGERDDVHGIIAITTHYDILIAVQWIAYLYRHTVGDYSIGPALPEVKRSKTERSFFKLWSIAQAKIVIAWNSCSSVGAN